MNQQVAYLRQPLLRCPNYLHPCRRNQFKQTMELCWLKTLLDAQNPPENLSPEAKAKEKSASGAKKSVPEVHRKKTTCKSLSHLEKPEVSTIVASEVIKGRMYDFNNGRFLSVDPFIHGVTSQGINPYSYILNNPLAGTDPTGYIPCDPAEKDNCGEPKEKKEKRGKLKTRFPGLWNGAEFGNKSKSSGNVADTENQADKSLNLQAQNDTSEQDARRAHKCEMLGSNYPGCSGSDFQEGLQGVKEGIATTGDVIEEVLRPELASFIPILKLNKVRKAIDGIDPAAVEKAADTLSTVRKTGKAPNGYRGGRAFRNDGRGDGLALPRRTDNGTEITYKEYDINPYQRGVNRGAERIVVGSNGKAYLTTDHYKTFVEIQD